MIDLPTMNCLFLCSYLGVLKKPFLLLIILLITTLFYHLRHLMLLAYLAIFTPC